MNAELASKLGKSTYFRRVADLCRKLRIFVGSKAATTMKDWPLWEVFIRSKQGLSHKHVGSLHAADAQMAIENARDVYCRRNEGVSIWVVESRHLHASTEDAEAFFDPANDKVYRHPTFYDLPDAVKHM
jgi:ring-1,2-phenylacetyl-CoA epoxidase subunit PaaB